MDADRNRELLRRKQMQCMALAAKLAELEEADGPPPPSGPTRRERQDR